MRTKVILFIITISALILISSTAYPNSNKAYPNNKLYLLENNYNQQNNTKALEFDKKICNLGRFSINSGEKSCSFTFKNISGKPLVINSVLSSCGCTKPIWPKKPIMPNESGKIDVTYSNDQGPYPIDKSITVYTSASAKPIILRITGLPYGADKRLEEQFPIAIGPLGVVNNTFKLGQIAQGESKSGSVTIANLSKNNVNISFANLSSGLTISCEPKIIPANGIAEISYTVSSSPINWGNTKYKAIAVCNGVKSTTPLYIECMIIDNFTKLSKEEKNKSAMVIANNSSSNFGESAMNKTINSEFKLRNSGYSTLKIYKIDTNGSKIRVEYPKEVEAGNEFNIKTSFVTGNKKGDEIHTITLITNSPNRPLVNLFVIGSVK